MEGRSRFGWRFRCNSDSTENDSTGGRHPEAAGVRREPILDTGNGSLQLAQTSGAPDLVSTAMLFVLGLGALVVFRRAASALG